VCLSVSLVLKEQHMGIIPLITSFKSWYFCHQSLPREHIRRFCDHVPVAYTILGREAAIRNRRQVNLIAEVDKRRVTRVDCRHDVIGEVVAPQWRRHAAEHGVRYLDARRLAQVLELVWASVTVVAETSADRQHQVSPSEGFFDKLF